VSDNLHIDGLPLPLIQVPQDLVPALQLLAIPGRASKVHESRVHSVPQFPRFGRFPLHRFLDSGPGPVPASGRGPLDRPELGHALDWVLGGFLGLRVGVG
jgi:hypothetical protein